MVKKSLTVYGTVHRGRERVASLGDRITTFECDMLDGERVKQVTSYVKPDLVFHLAAQSRVAQSWQDPGRTFMVNVTGTAHLLEALRKIGMNPVVVVAGAAAVYGNSKDNAPIKEDQGFSPSSPYAVSKVATDLLAELYWKAHRMKVIRVRPFNITGPDMRGDACSDFAKGIVEIEKGQRESLKVGDLDSVRDLTDVRDAIEALWLIAERGAPGTVYNLCSGLGYHIQDILSTLISMSSASVNVVHNNAKKRVLEDQFQIGDNSRLRALGWKPRIAIEKTLLDMLNFCRSNQ